MEDKSSWISFTGGLDLGDILRGRVEGDKPPALLALAILGATLALGAPLLDGRLPLWPMVCIMACVAFLLWCARNRSMYAVWGFQAFFWWTVIAATSMLVRGFAEVFGFF